MSSNPALAAALAWSTALAAGCGGLADGDYRGEALAVVQGTLTQAGPVEVAGELSLALQWAPASDHEALLNLLGGSASAPWRAVSRSETCTDLAPSAGPLCDGTAAQGSRRCDWTDGRVASLLRVVDYRAHLPGGFEIAIRDLPPEAARYDLSRQGGSGWFALASVVAFDDLDRDGAFHLGTPEDPPEPTLASSGRQTYLPGPDQPRRSYLVAYLDGLIAHQSIDPEFAEVLLFLPQGFSVWVEEEWLDRYRRTTASGRLWKPIDTPIEIFMPTQTVAGCERGRRETIQLTAIPPIPTGEVLPTWCSEDRFRATWSRIRTDGCVTTEERYSGDFSCAASLPPAWDCPEPTTGSLLVSVTTAGQDPDPDGYLVRIDGGTPLAVGQNGSVAAPVVSPGGHGVAIAGLADNCAAVGAGTVQVSAAAGQTAYVAFTVECWRPGAIRVSIEGGSAVPDGFAVSVDGGAPRTIWDADTFPGLRPGAHVVSVAGLADYCQMATANPLVVEVLPGATADASFRVDCVLPNGEARLTVTTTGADLPSEYLFTVGDSSGWAVVDMPIPSNGSWPFVLPMGWYSAWIPYLPPNCSFTSPGGYWTFVAPGQTTDWVFTIECREKGSFTVTTTTTGADIDPYGYWFRWSGAGQGEARVPANGSTTIAAQYAGEYQLTLGGLARNCSMVGPNARSFTVAPGQNTDLAFAVECVATGSLAITAATAGADADEDGYEVGVLLDGQGWAGVHVPANGAATLPGLVPGAYQVAVSGMAANCEATHGATATVVGGAATPVAVDVRCQPDRGLTFVSEEGQIYFIHSNGTGATLLVTGLPGISEPTFSPDGSRLAFTSYQDGTYHIYVANADGSNPRRLTSEAAFDDSPAWSPDGRRIAFVSGRDGGPDIYVMDADGSSPVRLTTSQFAFHPDWSPDGTRIAFDNGYGIHVMNADGSGSIRISGGWYASVPDWSPDGSEIAFTRNGGIMVVRADGTGERSVPAPGYSTGYGPVRWSPDGRYLVTEIYNPGYAGSIVTMRPDGTNAAYVTRGSWPTWRP